MAETESRGSIEEGVRWWAAWLSDCFPSRHLAKTRGACASPDDEAVWHVEFQDGKLGRIHITSAALELTEDDFARVTHKLSRMDWYAQLDELIRIRIEEGGSVRRVG